MPSRDYEKLSRAELIRELRSYQKASAERRGPDELKRVLADLQIHQEELKATNQELIDSQQRLQESRDRYAALYDSAPIGYATLDSRLVIRELNLTAAVMMGVNRRMVLDTEFQYYVTPADAVIAYEHRRRMRAREERVSTELRLLDRQTRRELPVLLLSVRSEHDAGLYRTAITDITERKRHEEEMGLLLASEQGARAAAERANREKDEFLSMVSHELRTPLVAVLGYSQMLAKKNVPAATAAQMAGVIAQNALRQKKMIDDLLDLGRLMAGKFRMEMRPTDLREVAAAAETVARLGADAKGVQVETRRPKSPCVVVGDPARLQQVVENLLVNAVKFTPAGGRVRMTVRRTAGAAEILISDTGEGIAPEFLPHIFQRFRQADSSAARPHGGLGLGLAISKELVERHGGTIEAASEGPGKGAEFRIRLPLSAVSAAAFNGAHPVRRRRAASKALSGRGVLVVDDDADTRRLLEMVLSHSGARVETAGKAEEALLALQQFRPDVLVSDIGMPGEDGYSLIRRVRMLPEPEGGGVPAVAVTAFASSDDRDRALEAGFQAHVAKPVETANLLEVVADLLGRPAGACPPESKP